MFAIAKQYTHLQNAIKGPKCVHAGNSRPFGNPG
jgi:hypothetical protein